MENTKNKIKELRLSKHLTQQALADELHVTKQAISKWEKGKSIPDITSVELLSSYFGVSADYLINDNLETAKSVTTDVISNKRPNKLYVILITALVLMFAAVVALSITLGVVSNKDKSGNLDIPLGDGTPDKVAINGFEITYLTEETYNITKNDKTVLLNFNIYNSTDFSKTCSRDNFSIDINLLYIDNISPDGYTFAPHEELKLSVLIVVDPSIENLGAIPYRSATVKYAGQAIAIIRW